jgi:hypothetical protein
MAHSVIQEISVIHQANAGSSSQTFGSTPVTGRSIVVVGWGYSAGNFNVGGAADVADNKGNTYAVLQSGLQVGMRCFVAYCHNITGGASFQVTVDPTSSSNFYAWWAAEVDGLDPAGTYDVTSSNNGGSTTTPATGTTGTTTQAAELALAAVVSSLTQASITVGGSFNEELEELDSSTYQAGEADSLTLSATGTQSAAWTFATSAQFSAIIVTFKDAPVGFTAAGSGTFAVVGGAQNSGSFGAAGSGAFVVTGSYTPPLGFAAAGQGSFSVVGTLSTSARFSARGDAQFVVTPNSPGVSARFAAHGEAVFSVIPVPQTAPPTLLAPYGGLST